MSSEMREGFLCPICMSDLGDEIQLQMHFEERHSKEDPIFLQSIKDLFGKAKKKILSSQEQDFFSFGNLDAKTAVSGIFGPSNPSPPPPNQPDHDPVSGVPLHRTRDLPGPRVMDHTAAFKEERTRKLERNKSTNQVLIRLEKLMTNLPSDPGKRRAHERAAVPWVDEELVKLCPYCAKSFNVAARRKHHCRLCGAVLCNDCSTAVSFEFARKVTNPATISRFRKAEEDPPEVHEQQSTPKSKLGALFKSKNLSGSHESLNSIRNLMDLKPEEQFRSCHLCLEILERQDLKVEKATAEPILVQFYERLQAHIAEGRDMGATYRTMSESLNRGEEDFNLSEAKFLRVKILKIAENVDIISRKISILDTEYPESENPGFPSGLQLQLQQRIRMSAVNFVKEGLVGLPGLPSEEEFVTLKKKRRENAAKKVADEKQAAKAAKLRFEQESSRRSSRLGSTNAGGVGESPSHAGTTPKAVKHSNGLVLSSSNYTCSSDDPMVQQIHNIQEFIKEAKRLGKFDEVASLEENLKELQAEYQKSQKELEDNFKAFGGLFHKTSPRRELFGVIGGAAATEEENSRDAPDDDYDASGKNPFV